jgi:hypothetical protein
VNILFHFEAVRLLMHPDILPVPNFFRCNSPKITIHRLQLHFWKSIQAMKS